jgi:uncharacterized protein with HEPN domain
MDIIEAAEAIARFVADLDQDRFVGDDLVRSAVLHKLQVIGEAAAHVSDETRAASSHVPWREVVGFRNFTVHAYFAVDWASVWTTATLDAPAIAEAVRTVIGDAPGPRDDA